MNPRTRRPRRRRGYTSTQRRRRGTHAAQWAAAAAVLVAAACGNHDGEGGAVPSPDEPPVVSTTGDSKPEGSETGGFEIELVGWSIAPYPDGAKSVAVGFGGNDYVALHIRACLDDDADVMPHLLGVVTVGDADGEPFNTGNFQGAPVVSPAGFEPPAPGECAEGWVYPAFEHGVQPVTAVWLDTAGTYGGNQSWPLGEPYPAGPLPLFGDVRAVGDTWEVADDASWTVHGVTIARPDDPLAPPRDLEPGMAWVVVDATYCPGSSPGTVHESLGVVVDGWAGRGTPRTVEEAIEPTSDDGCERRAVAVAMPAGMAITAVTGTDHTGPWWPIDPPVEVTS